MKLAESPFYAAGGGQVADVGTIECEDGDCRARVEDVFRLGDDQALAVVVEEGALRPGEPVLARVDHVARHATEANHTATHLLQAALRERLGGHVRQAGSYVGPDKLRFDFSHGQGLSAEELRDVEDRVNEWIARNDPVRPITTTLDEAKRLGAMALFGEKYGDVVRMVEIGEGEYSRELCGGTHVRSTAEIGPFQILGETSSAANVRRIEALTGPAAVELLREHDRLLEEVAAARTRPKDARRAGERARARAQASWRRRSSRAAAGAGAGAGGRYRGRRSRVDVAGALVLTAAVEVADAKALLDIADRMKGRLGGRRDPARRGGRRARAPGRQRRAGARRARRQGRRRRQGGRRGRRRRRRRARHAGAGRRARAGLGAAIEAGRAAIRWRRSRRRWPGLMRVLALDYGSARCGCALSDPTGTIVTPIEPVYRPRQQARHAALARLVQRRDVERVVVGLPLSLTGGLRADARGAGVRTAPGTAPWRGRCRSRCTTSVSPPAWPSAWRARSTRERGFARGRPCSRAGPRRRRTKVPFLSRGNRSRQPERTTEETRARPPRARTPPRRREGARDALA